MPKRILVVLSICLLFAVHLIFIEPSLKSTEEKLRSKNLLSSYPHNTLEEISFGQLQMVRTPSGIRLRKPFNHPASAEICNPLFTGLSRVSAREVLVIGSKEGKSLKNYGLDPPRIKVSLKGGVKKTRLFFFLPNGK